MRGEGRRTVITLKGGLTPPSHAHWDCLPKVDEEEEEVVVEDGVVAKYAI